MTERTEADIENELAGILAAEQQVEYDESRETSDPAPDASAVAAAEETEASRKGWVPKHKFKGPAEQWVDAGTFNRRGEQFNKALQSKVAALEAQIQSFEGTKAAFAKFHQETIAKKDAELASAMKQLRIQKSEATQEGDHDLAVALEDRIEALREERTAVKQVATETKTQPAQADNPVLLEWIDDGNTWFRDDAKLRAYAVSLGEEFRKAGDTTQGRKFLDKVAAHMREEFPRQFKSQPNAAARSAGVESGSGASTSTGGHTERDLPLEDLRLMKQFVSEGLTTREQFLKSYFSRNG